MMNVVVVGRLVAPAEVATSAKTGKQFVRFTVASNKGRKDLPADFVQVMTGAVNLAPYLGKGAIVSVTGDLSVSAYIGKQDGQAKPNITVMAQKVELLTRGEVAPQAQAPVQTQTQAPAYAPAPQGQGQRQGQGPVFAPPAYEGDRPVVNPMDEIPF